MSAAHAITAVYPATILIPSLSAPSSIESACATETIVGSEQARAIELTPPDRPHQRDVTTSLCVEYLLANKEQDRADAFQRLMHVMLKATDKLYIPEPVWSPTDDSAKYGFIQIFLLHELNLWAGKNREEIEDAAQHDKFRYLGRKCRQRILNEIRAIPKRQKCEQRYQDKLRRNQPAPRPEPLEGFEFHAILAACDFLSPRARDIAAVLFELRELPLPNWATALAERFNVSVQSARKYLRNLRREAAAAIIAGHRVALHLARRLAEFIVAAESASPGGLWGEAEGETAIQTYQFDAYFRERRNQRPD